MDITVTINDGPYTALHSSEVHDLADLLYFLHQVVQSSGYSYVNNLAAEKSDGDMVWSDDI